MKGICRSTSITVEQTLLDKAQQFCEDENVSFSAYVEALCRADLAARGLYPKIIVNVK